MCVKLRVIDQTIVLITVLWVIQLLKIPKGFHNFCPVLQHFSKTAKDLKVNKSFGQGLNFLSCAVSLMTSESFSPIHCSVLGEQQCSFVPGHSTVKPRLNGMNSKFHSWSGSGTWGADALLGWQGATRDTAARKTTLNKCRNKQIVFLTTEK